MSIGILKREEGRGLVGWRLVVGIAPLSQYLHSGFSQANVERLAG